jgi:hypothetical protein
MPHVLRVPSDVTPEAVRSALDGVRASRVALALPPGRPSRLGTSEVMRALHSYALVLGKELVIIGGDEHVRAIAVAAGFAAATSLDEWGETQPQLPAVLARSGATGALWELTDLAFVSDDWFAVSLPGALEYPYTDEPPPYVQELLASGMAIMDGIDSASVSTTDTMADSPSEAHEGAFADDLDPDEMEALALREAHEHYEEHITSAIRESGGVSRPLQFEIRRLTSHADASSQPAVNGLEQDDSPAL